MENYDDLKQLSDKQIISYFFILVTDEKDATYIQYDGTDNIYFYKLNRSDEDWRLYYREYGKDLGIKEYNNNIASSYKRKVDKYRAKQHEKYIYPPVAKKEGIPTNYPPLNKINQNGSVVTYNNSNVYYGDFNFSIEGFNTSNGNDIYNDEIPFWVCVGRAMNGNKPWRCGSEKEIVKILQGGLLYHFKNKMFIPSTVDKMAITEDYLASIKYKCFEFNGKIKIENIRDLVKKYLVDFVPKEELEDFRESCRSVLIRPGDNNPKIKPMFVMPIFDNPVKPLNDPIKKEPIKIEAEVKINYNLDYALLIDDKYNNSQIKYYLMDRGMGERIRKFEYVIDSMWNLCEYKNPSMGYNYCFNIKTLYDFLFAGNYIFIGNMKKLVEQNKIFIKDILITEIHHPITFTIEVKKFIKNNDTKYMSLKKDEHMSKGTRNQPLLYIKELYRNT